MNYTCAYWKDAQDLDTAQKHKLERVRRKLQLQPGMRVLDIGCGWGSLASHAAERHGVHQITMMGGRATYPANEFLSAEIGLALPLRPGMDREQYRRESAARFADRLPELERRLETEPAVAGVTLEGRLPGRDDLVEVEGVPGSAVSGTHRIDSSGVAPDYFDVLGVRLLAGRTFRASETGELGRSLVVSEAFERSVLGEGTAIGRRVRFFPRPGPQQMTGEVEPGPWLEIVGVVQNLEASVLDAEWASPKAFYPVAPGELQSANLLIRVRNGDVDGFAPRLRQITAALDPELRLESLGNLATMRDYPIFAMTVSVLLSVLASVLLLSAAGIHALISLAVTRCRREIAIRRALGGHAFRLLTTIFSWTAWQLGLGGILGSLAGGALLGSGRTGPDAAILLGGIVLLMLAAGLVAAVGPALRALGIQPTEALREE